MEVFKILLTKFKGKVVGSDDCNMGSLKEEFFDGFTPDENVDEVEKEEKEEKDEKEEKEEKPILKATSESNGHGKAWELDIQKEVYGIKKTYKHTEKYDIPKEDNLLHHKNVSIKTSGSMNICMSDIRRLLNSENMDVVCIIYQQNGDIKEAIKTVVFDFDEFKGTLIKDLEKCNYTLEGWLKQIDDYVNYVKKLPKDYYPISKKLPQKEKEHLIKKKPLCEGLKYFVVNPKIDSSQQRVQCSINLNKIDIKKKISEGGVLFGKEYTKSIVSSTRNRKKK